MADNERPVGVLPAQRRRSIPDNLWSRCPECAEMLFHREVERNVRVCPKCDYHFSLSPEAWLEYLADARTARVLSDDARHRARAMQVRMARRKVVLFVEGEERSDDDERLLEQAFGMALSDELPLICVYRSREGGLVPVWRWALHVEALASARLPHVVLLTDPRGQRYFTDWPLGDVVLAEPLPGSGSPIPQDVMIDRFVSRSEVREVLRGLLSFFGIPASR